MRTLVIALLLGIVSAKSQAEISISNVEVFSGHPWKDVVIGYKIAGGSYEEKRLEVTAKDNVTGLTYVCKTLEGEDLTMGTHVIKWNASQDGVKFKSNDVVFTLRIVPKPLYRVIDLSGGPTALEYSVTELDDIPNGGWTDEYKTTKLVLRWINAGEFTMGDRNCDNNQPHQVILTEPFYIGVFEVTRKQYELVTGTKYPSLTDMNPKFDVSYNNIRGYNAGAGWPANNDVDDTSFLGKLRAKTGLAFDLPTEAQWEYACRAGTTTDYNNGSDICGALGRFTIDKRYPAACADVGLYLPNLWGLYDMHGNANEWCLDWYGSIDAGTDPKGAISGSYRVMRGGDCYSWDSECCSYNRYQSKPSEGNHAGFRIALPLQK